VPPSLRNRGAGGPGGDGDTMRRRTEENSVRVTNLSEETREDDLRVCACTCVCVHAHACARACVRTWSRNFEQVGRQDCFCGAYGVLRILWEKGAAELVDGRRFGGFRVRILAWDVCLSVPASQPVCVSAFLPVCRLCLSVLSV
jgi:hypothetical protein